MTDHVGYYPVALDLTARAVLVVGGGEVGERKVVGLLAAGARVTVVSPRVTSTLADLAAAGRIVHLARAYRRDDLDAHELVFVAIDDPAVAARIVADARARRRWINVADAPRECDFILPSVIRRGDLVVAVSTGGKSPTVARVVRERIERVITDEYGQLTALVADVREELARGERRPDAAAWRAAVDEELLSLVRGGNASDARRRLRERLAGA